MAWYTDMSVYHYLQYGAVADRLKRKNLTKSSTSAGKQFPRPTQESEKEHKPFQMVLPRNPPPPRLTDGNTEPVPNKKAHKNLAFELSKKKD